MADDPGMAFLAQEPQASRRGIADIAREEFSLTARAFFAPVVGVVTVIRHLVKEADGSATARARSKDAA